MKQILPRRGSRVQGVAPDQLSDFDQWEFLLVEWIECYLPLIQMFRVRDTTHAISQSFPYLCPFQWWVVQETKDTVLDMMYWYSNVTEMLTMVGLSWLFFFSYHIDSGESVRVTL